MSGLDLYESQTAERMTRLQTTNTVEPGIFEGFLRGTGMEAMRQLARTGRAAAMAGAAVPIILDPLLAKDNYSGVTLTDRYFKGMDEIFEPAIKAWTPEPNEVGVAGQVTGTLLTMLPMVMAGGPGQALALASMQMGTAQDLVQQHGETVSAEKAYAAGAVMSAGLGLGIKVPIFGRSLWQRVLLGGAGFNVFQGAAMRGAAGTILEGTPAAEQFKAFDPLELTIDLLLGAGFGGIAHLSPAARAEGEQAWKALEAWGKSLKPSDVDALAVMRQAQHINVDTLPGKPATAADLNAHVEKVKTALDQTLRGQQINVETAGPEAPKANRYIIDNAINAEGPTEIRVIRDGNGNVAIDDGAGLVDVTGMLSAGKSIEEAIATTFGDHPQGSKPDLTKVRQAGAEQQTPAFEPVPERFVEAYENGLDLMKEAERIRVEEGLPQPPDPTPPGPSKVYTAVKEAFDKTIGTRLGEDYPDNIARLVDAGYQAMARRYGKTVDQLLAFRPLRVTDELPGMNALLEQKPFDIGEVNILFQEAKPVWYSQLTRQIEGLKQNTAPASQWKSMIDNLKGIKPEEIEWTGLKEWLDIQGRTFALDNYIDELNAKYGTTGDTIKKPGWTEKDLTPEELAKLKKLQTEPDDKGKVTRQQILDYLNSNGVKVDEVMKGQAGEPSLDDPAIATQVDFLRKSGWEPTVNEEDRTMIAFTDPESGDFVDAMMIDRLARDEGSLELQDIANAAIKVEEYWGGAGRESPTKFGSSDLQLPGAKPGSYRELLLTLPNKRPAYELLSISQMKNFLKRNPRPDLDGLSDLDKFKRLNKELRDGGAQSVFQSSHWEEPNVLAHIRFNERTATAESLQANYPELAARLKAEGREARLLFLEEMQNDLAQKIRKMAMVKAAAEGLKEGSPEFVERVTELTKKGFPEEGLPALPFSGRTDAWTALVLKRMIRYAAENGFDLVAWTRGEQQVERYTNALRQVVDRIEWEKTPEGVQIKGYKGEMGAPVVDDAVRDAGLEALRRNDNLGFDFAGDALGALVQHRADWQTRWEVPDEADRIAIQALINGTTAARRQRMRSVVDTRYGENELSDAIGKTLAEQIRNDPGQKGVIEGNNIRVDDTGMAGFYDRIVPKIANDILKKLGGGKVSMAEIQMGKKDEAPTVEAGTINRPELAEMTDSDMYAFEGAENFPDGSRPLFADTTIRVNGADLGVQVVADQSGIHFIGETVAGDQFEISLPSDMASAAEARSLMDQMWAEGEGGLWRNIQINSGEFEKVGDVQKQPAIEITPQLRDKIMEGMPLFQKGGDQPRGYFQPGEAFTLGMLEGANKSTPVHEVGHMFLQLLKDIADQADSPREVRADVDVAFKWLGVDPKQYDAMTFEDQRPYHEKWARGFEAYMREGRAPTPELRSVFQRFKEWLLEVYRTLTQLNVKLDDDIRGVFDRLLGAERQVEPGETQAVKSRFLADLQELGGIQKSAMEDITGEKRFGKGIKGVPWGLFKEQGKSVDDLATMMRDRGWPIPEDEVDGGVQVLKDLIRSELEGERAMKTGETPEGKDVTEADAEQIMREAADLEEQAAERFNYQDTPEYRAEVSRIRADRDFQLAKVLQGEDPIGAEARRIVAENPDQTMVFGEGEAMTARDYLDQAQAEYEQALKDAEMYRVAGDCMLGVD